MPFDFVNNPEIAGLKMIAIIYITAIISIIAYSFSLFSENYILYFVNDNDPEKLKQKSSFVLLCETTAIYAFFAILTYFGRNTLTKIPFPLDGMYGFEYIKVKEVASTQVLFVMIVAFSGTLYRKLQTLRSRAIKY